MLRATTRRGDVMVAALPASSWRAFAFGEAAVVSEVLAAEVLSECFFDSMQRCASFSVPPEGVVVHCMESIPPPINASILSIRCTAYPPTPSLNSFCSASSFHLSAR